MEINKIYNEDCLTTMANMSNNFIDLVVTSPPYDSLRLYNDYSFDFENIAKELYRIIKTGGIVVWVVNDSTIDGSESGTSFRQALYFKEIGFRLHDTMIYEKNGPSFPARKDSNRYSQIFEYMFIFSKGKPKNVNLICDKPNRWTGTTHFGEKGSYRGKDDVLKERCIKPISDFSPRYNIWKYNRGYGYSTKDEIAFQHPAIFPDELAEDHIISWSNQNDLVYDPFTGSGTTLKMAILNSRNFIGSEISEEYCKIAEERIKNHRTDKNKEGLF